MASLLSPPRSIGRVDLRRFARLLPYLAVEAAIFFAFFAVYFVARGMAPDRPELATDNAQRIIDFQQALGIFREPAWHEFAMRREWLIEASNFTYNWLHMPVIFGMGAVFFLGNQRKYRVLRNALLLSAFLAVPIYWLFPLTPPRLLELHGLDYGFADTVGGARRSMIANDYAAMPSFHFGWILLVVMGVWWCYRSPLLRVGFAVFLAWMTWSIVVTSNHYFVDFAVGGTIVVVTFVLALRWERFIRRRPDVGRRWLYRRGDFRQPF